MATNIDKVMYPSNGVLMGATEPDMDSLGMDIELDDSDFEGIPEDGMVVELGQGELDTPFDANLVDFIDESVLVQLASDLSTDIDNDKNSRRDWEQTYIEGLKLMGLKYEERTEPWAGACGAVHPMITEAVMRFQAETIMETFPAQGPVMTKIIGKETPEKREAAARVKEDLNYQLTELMPEFRAEHEKMLWALPSAGSAFKKVYYDPSLGRQVSLFVTSEDVILPYGTSDLQMCPRLTHRMRKTKNELRKLQVSGFYADIDLPDPDKTKDDIQTAKDTQTGFSDLNDDRHTLYESHVDLVIKGIGDADGVDEEDAIALPYVFTMLRGTTTVLAVRRNWREDDPLKLRRQHFAHYQYVPGFGAYGFGLFHLIGGLAKVATSTTRQLVDAGTLSNLPGGLKSRSLRIKGDDTPISPGEFRDVDVGSGTIRDSILPLPYKEPSQTLFQLLGSIIEEGRRFAATADVQVSDMSAQAPVGTTLALLERQLKPLTAVQARTHFSMKQELKLLAEIIRDHTPENYTYEPDTGPKRAKREDYSHVDILPVSDPNAATMSQRIVQYQAVIQMAQMAPDIYDLPELHRGMLDIIGIKNAAKLVPLPTDQKPMDPVTENMRMLRIEPVKAFVYQDHEAHIAVHNALMQDPQIQALMGQNPKAAQMAAAMHAHIAEHTALSYRQKIEAQLGLHLPPEQTDVPPEVEVGLSTLMAQAAQQVLQESQQAAAAQAAQQAAQDPILQMQKQELEIKTKEADAKVAKSQADIVMDQRRFELERAQAIADTAIAGGKLELDSNKAGGQLLLEANRQDLERDKAEADVTHKGILMASQIDQADKQHHATGVQMGVDIAKHQADMRTKQKQLNKPKPKPKKGK